MTKAAIFSLLPVKPNSTIASVRIARWLSDFLGVELLDGPQIGDKELDVLFIVNGSTLFCKCLPQLAQAVTKAKEVVWVQNDYTLPPPKAESDAQSPFRKAFADRGLVPHYWTTCGEHQYATDKSALVNWNALGYIPDLPRAPLQNQTWFYYGAFREHRTDSFLFVDRLLPAWIVSSTSKKFDQYAHVDRRDPIPQDHFHRILSTHGMGLYLQDYRSANKNHQPATRFYEMLSVGLPMVFTVDCVRTLAQYGYDVRDYALYEETKKEMMDARKTVADQQARWVRNFEKEIQDQVTLLAKGLGL